MNGNQVFENKYINLINNIINKNPDKYFLKGYYFYLVSNDLAYTSIYDYIRYIVNFIDYHKINVKELRLDHYTEFLMQIKEYTPAYQIGVYSSLKWFSKYLFINQFSNNDFMEHISSPKLKEKKETKERRENGVLNKDEIKRYVKTTKSGVGSKRAIARQKEWRERDLLIVMLFLNTGMRCSALYKLDVESINLNTRILTTIDKGDNTREFYLSDEIMELLQLWLNKRKELLMGIPESALFISNQRTRMDNSSISRVVKKYAQDIKNISPHKLRATFGTQLLAETGNLYLTQQSMGHSNPKTTEIYIRGRKNDDLKTTSNIMSRICSLNN